METMEDTRNMARARGRAALRKRKKEVERDYWQHRDWLRGLEPHARARYVGHWARTPAPRTSHWHGANPRRYQSGRGGFTRQERKHLLDALGELREMRGEFVIVAPRGSLLAGTR